MQLASGILFDLKSILNEEHGLKSIKDFVTKTGKNGG